jgi:subtilisin family serine protease
VRTTHSEFAERISNGYTAVNDANGVNDCNGHGTHVAGTVAGTVYGVAKGATIHPVRVLNCNGSGTTSMVIAGIDWVTGNHEHPAIANMSLGGGASTTLDNAVRSSIAAGVTYAVAAGNEGRDACGSSPARVAEALTVGATTNTDARASFSNYGACLDLFAPGQSIKSAGYANDTAAVIFSGTSMASPHVAGAAALFLAANPASTPAQVVAWLNSNATPGRVMSAGTGSPNRLLYTFGIGAVTQPTPTFTPTPTPTDTATPTATPTDTPTATFTPTATDTPVPTDTPTPTATPIPTDTPTETPLPTVAPTATDTALPDAGTPAPPVILESGALSIPVALPTAGEGAAVAPPIAVDIPTPGADAATVEPAEVLTLALPTPEPPTATPAPTYTPQVVAVAPTETFAVPPTETPVPSPTDIPTATLTATDTPPPTMTPLPTPTREPLDVAAVLYTSLPPVFVGAGVLLALVIVAAGLSVIRGPRDI